MTDHELKYWLALKWVAGLGNVGFINLLEAFGTPEEVFQAPAAKLQATPGIGSKVAAQIKAFHKWTEVDRELSISHKLQVSIITCRDSIYPYNLINIYDFPPYLYVKGTLREDDICIAVVGSRMASAYGRFSTERLCRELAMKGITVVSGLARGIDTAAHQGSLAAKGRTIAVLGCGLDIVYPPENKALFEKIPPQGAIITEFPFGTPPLATNFPTRNRIISGLSLGVVVVEANYRSGSLITARVALEQGREVFAVPGSIDADGSKGTNKLIKDGAKLIEGADDILEEILPQIRRKFAAPAPAKVNQAKRIADVHDLERPSALSQNALTEREVKLMKQISANPLNVDQLISLTGEKAGEILNTLLLLELKGIISQLPGKMFILKEK
jgi:DNA processing protein